MYLRVCIGMFFICVHTCVCIHIYIYIYVDIYICICRCIYIYTHKCTTLRTKGFKEHLKAIKRHDGQRRAIDSYEGPAFRACHLGPPTVKL